MKHIAAPRGFTIVGLLTTVAAGSVVVGILVTLLSWSGHVQSSGLSRIQLELFRNDLLTLLKSDHFSTYTVNGPANAQSMACLKNSTPCTTDGSPMGSPLGEQPFVLYSSTGSVFFDGINGVGLNGSAGSCSPGAPVGSCPYRLSLMWAPMCQPGSCVNPQIKIITRFRHADENVSQGFLSAHYSQSIYLPPIQPPQSPPVCSGLFHLPNERSFTISWTKGSGNGGAGGCTIQYQRNGGQWAPVASPATVNCDEDGASAGMISLPGDGWVNGPWSGPSAVRLVRNSDGAVMCDSIGTLTCNITGGSAVSTPMKDEDCDGSWDNSLTCGVASYQTSLTGAALQAGNAYTCPPTYDAGGCTYPFFKVSWVADAYYFYRWVSIFNPCQMWPTMDNTCSGTFEHSASNSDLHLQGGCGPLSIPSPDKYKVRRGLIFNGTSASGTVPSVAYDHLSSQVVNSGTAYDFTTPSCQANGVTVLTPGAWRAGFCSYYGSGAGAGPPLFH